VGREAFLRRGYNDDEAWIAELQVSRVVRAEAAKRVRERHLAAAGLALEGLERADLDAEERRDRLAFVSLTLAEVQRSVEQTAEAWEKRGYWVKADRFRADWAWLPGPLRELDEILASEHLAAAPRILPRLGGHIPQASARLRASGALWHGAWDRWKSRGL
jgi:hypothetical protein